MKDIYTIFPFFCLHCSFLSISHQAFQIAEEFLIRKKNQKNIYFVVFDRDWRIYAVSMVCFLLRTQRKACEHKVLVVEWALLSLTNFSWWRSTQVRTLGPRKEVAGELCCLVRFLMICQGIKSGNSECIWNVDENQNKVRKLSPNSCSSRQLRTKRWNSILTRNWCVGFLDVRCLGLCNWSVNI